MENQSLQPINPLSQGISSSPLIDRNDLSTLPSPAITQALKCAFSTTTSSLVLASGNDEHELISTTRHHNQTCSCTLKDESDSTQINQSHGQRNKNVSVTTTRRDSSTSTALDALCVSNLSLTHFSSNEEFELMIKHFVWDVLVQRKVKMECKFHSHVFVHAYRSSEPSEVAIESLYSLQLNHCWSKRIRGVAKSVEAPIRDNLLIRRLEPTSPFRASDHQSTTRKFRGTHSKVMLQNSVILSDHNFHTLALASLEAVKIINQIRATSSCNDILCTQEIHTAIICCAKCNSLKHNPVLSLPGVYILLGETYKARHQFVAVDTNWLVLSNDIINEIKPFSEFSIPVITNNAIFAVKTNMQIVGTYYHTSCFYSCFKSPTSKTHHVGSSATLIRIKSTKNLSIRLMFLNYYLNNYSLV